MQSFWWNIKSPRWQHPYSPDLVPCNLWLFPKLKSPLKGKRFQTVHEIEENMMGQLMATERTVRSQGAYSERDWGIFVLCTVFLISCIFFNKCLFHITWLDAFWIDLVCLIGPCPYLKWNLFLQRFFSQGFPFSMTNTNDDVFIKARNLDSSIPVNSISKLSSNSVYSSPPTKHDSHPHSTTAQCIQD